jgi:3-hydroxyisobutyrate dehydrogenase-like beta-hydroxyacid dehydrogenase
MTAEIVGCIGLGAMGGGMAANLVSGGFSVVGYDPSEKAQAAARAAGVELAATPEEVARRATRLVISMVRTAEQTEQVMFGPDSVVAAGRDELIVSISSTLDAGTVASIDERLRAVGLRSIGATVSGGDTGARAGTLTFMLAGPPGDLAALRPVFEAMGSNLFEVGKDVGAAQAAKHGVQLAFGVNMLGAFEALQVASQRGVDETQLMEILAVSVGDSWVARNWPRVRSWWEHYVRGEDLDILLKDMRAMLAESDQAELPLPVTALSFQLMRDVWPAAAARRADALAGR